VFSSIICFEIVRRCQWPFCGETRQSIHRDESHVNAFSRWARGCSSPRSTGPLVVKELNVVGSRSGPFPRVPALLASGRVHARPPISRVFALFY
jgi:hypothetical protein